MKFLENIYIYLWVPGRKDTNAYKTRVKCLHRTIMDFAYAHTAGIPDWQYLIDHPYCYYSALQPLYCLGNRIGNYFGFFPDDKNLWRAALKGIKDEPNKFIKDAAWLMGNLVSFAERNSPELPLTVETRILYKNTLTGSEFGDLRTVYRSGKIIERK